MKKLLYLFLFVSTLSVAQTISGKVVAIKDGDTIDGMNDEGKMTPEVQWICRYEDSLIEPLRPVLDIDTGKYAAGNRN